MQEPDRCDLHEAVESAGDRPSDALLILGRSPIAEECRRCSVCRWARTYVERRIAERSGRSHPTTESAEAAWRELQSALGEARRAMRSGR